MIDVCLVRYCPSKKDDEIFEKTCAYLKDKVNLFIHDNTEDNIGLTKARNRLVTQGSSEFVCFMDFDLSQMDIDWDALTAQCRDSKVGMVFPQSDGVKGKGWSEPVAVPCNFMLMRRKVFVELGGFNERFFVAYGDWDLICRMRAAGYKTLQHNESIVQHIGLSDDNKDKERIWDADRAVYRELWGVESLELPKKKVIIYDKNSDHYPKWLTNLNTYLVSKGYEVEVIFGKHTDDKWRKKVKGCKHLFMWNGAEAEYQPIKMICDKSGVGWSVVEVAWFPQSKNWFVDPLGINADASLMDDDLSWVTDADEKNLEKVRHDYWGGRTWEPSDYILVPLQLEWDTNIILHSPYKKMQQLIDHCEKKFEGQRIIFKRHPHDVHGKYKTKHELVVSGGWLDYLSKAKEVYGINSTCLMEAALLGVPVTQLGNGYLKKHADKKERLLAALCAKQIHINDTDLSRWIDPLLEGGPDNDKPRVGVVSDTRAEEMKAAVRLSDNVELVEANEELSNVHVVVTDDPKVIAKAGRMEVAILALATGEVPNMILHEFDGLFYLSEDWMRSWLKELTNISFRNKLTTARKWKQQTLDREVTVIIPCYNQAKYLERSIGSVMEQTVKASVIVIDDGSPDDVPGAMQKIKNKYPEADIRLYRQNNKGLSGARNTGFREAKTAWVVPLDADDRIEPKFIEKTLEIAEKSNGDVVYTDITTDNYGFATMKFQPNYLNTKNTIVCTALVRKELWEEAGGYDESMRMGYEDWEFWLRVFQAGGSFVKAKGGSLFYYHDAGESMLSKTSRNQEEIVSYMRSKHWKFFGVPRVTVVIPCYNQAKYLDRCIESVVNQTEKDVEIIVVDDGSPDNVSEVVKALSVKHRAKINLVRQENKGLPAARNAGFWKAKGEWVLPLDADDWLGSTDYIEKCLEKAKGEVGVVMTDGLSVKGTKTNSCVDLQRMRCENTMHACQMIRKQVWMKMGGYDVSFKEGYEDWEFWVNCLENGVKFAKAKGIILRIDDDHDGRMTPNVQTAAVYWKLLKMIKDKHPTFFGGKPNKKHPVCDLTVVLSSYNQRETLPLVLESYKQQTAWPVEVIINDDGSTDGTLEWLDSLEGYPFDIRYVTREHSWYRLASGNNSAAKHTRANRILFTNGDQIHSPSSFESHCALPVDRVGGGVFKGIAQGPAQKVTMDMVTDWSQVKALQKKHPSAKNNMRFIKGTDPNKNPIGVWGGNFSVPASIFYQIGGYDENYDVGWGGEENDLVKRCVKAGCRVQWVMQSAIFHLDHPIRAYAYSMLGSKKYVKEL
jgi:glycosyltransferase involved in cell wall biosynthesis